MQNIRVMNNKNNKILIRNAWWTPDFLDAQPVSKRLQAEIDAYRKDPNCTANLWISKEDFTETEKAIFIYTVLYKKP